MFAYRRIITALFIGAALLLSMAANAGEIVVKGDGQDIANGDSTPTRADNTDYASQPVGDSRTLSYLIENTGSSNLTLGTVTISGPHASDFEVTDQPNSVLGSGTTWNGRDPSTTMQITFTPSADGVRSATVSIPNDDADENPFTFDTQGLGTSGETPDMYVEGNGNMVYHNDDTPSTSNGTDWESVLLDTQEEKTFLIGNEGTVDLNLSGSVNVTGSGFAVTTQPTSPIGAQEAATLRVTFSPSSRGEIEGTVTISSDDPDENPYVFSIRGTGVSPEMDVTGNGVSIADGDESPSVNDDTDFGAVQLDNDTEDRTFTIKNTGDGDLNFAEDPDDVVEITGDHASDFTVTSQPARNIRVGGGNQTFTIRFDPTAYGVRRATVSISNNDLDEDPYTFVILGTVGPDITVQGNGNTIDIGDDSPSVTDDTDFGSTPVDGGNDIVHTFTIENTGNDDLTLDDPAVTLSGAHASDFAITPPGISVGPGSTDTFTITFNPSGEGNRTATVSIGSDDPDEDPYTFAIKGEGAVSDIDVLRDGQSPNTDYGSVDYVSGSVTHTFTIRNLGKADLVLSGTPRVEIENGSPSDFDVIAQPDETIIPNGSTTFQIQFDPSSIGDHTATVDIESNDPDEATFSFSLEGEGAGPDMSVLGEGNTIADGSTSPETTNGTDFGDADIENDVVDQTFSIRNTGDGTLQLSADPHVQLTGTHATDFEVITQPGDEIAPNDPDLTFTVRFDPTVQGLREATVEIGSNDPNHKAYSFDIQGTGTVFPEIIVHGEGFEIVDGDTTPAVEDNTYFGKADIGGQTVVHQFTLGNQGSGDLQVGPPAASIDHAAFTITQQPAKIVNPHTRVAFEITFNPDTVGDAEGTVTIHSDDDDEDPYTFVVQGTGTSRPPATGGGGNSTPVPDAGPNLSVPTGFPVNVNGTLSFDADLGPASSRPLITTQGRAGLSYQWTFSVLYMDAGKPVYCIPAGSKALSSAKSFDTAIGTFVPDLPGEYVLTLTVTDDRGSWAVDQVTVTAIYDPDYQPAPDPVIGIAADSLTVAPIPFGDEVTFTFQGEGLPDVFWVAVHDLAGHRVWETSEDRRQQVTWDGYAEDGRRLPNGAYIYVVRILGDGDPFVERGILFILR